MIQYIRNGANLGFDSEREADIVEAVKKLSNSHKLGTLLSHLIRLAFESPEVYGNGDEVENLLAKMRDLGTTPTRYTYFNQITKEIEEMKMRVDSIYEMTLKTYTMCLMGKHLGLKDKSDNSLVATFLLERQIEAMCSKLGVDNMNHSFASNKLYDTHNKAQEIMEYILECYDGVVDELRTQLETDKVATELEGIHTSLDNLNSALKEKVVLGRLDVASGGEKTEAIKTDDKQSELEDEYIDFGTPDSKGEKVGESKEEKLESEGKPPVEEPVKFDISNFKAVAGLMGLDDTD